MEPREVTTVQRSSAVQDFAPGDTVRVGVRIREGDRERVQVFQGVVIALRGRAPGTTFVVRRVTYGVGIERTFPLYSPLVESVEVVRHGQVSQSNLFYLRGRSGRAARIKERAWMPTKAEDTPVVEAVETVEEPQAEQPQPEQVETATPPAQTEQAQ